MGQPKLNRWSKGWNLWTFSLQMSRVHLIHSGNFSWFLVLAGTGSNLSHWFLIWNTPKQFPPVGFALVLLVSHQIFPILFLFLSSSWFGAKGKIMQSVLHEATFELSWSLCCEILKGCFHLRLLSKTVFNSLMYLWQSTPLFLPWSFKFCCSVALASFSVR